MPKGTCDSLSAWGLFFPIIKILWTSSYVLFAGGWSLLLPALFYGVIDVWGYRRWAWFLYRHKAFFEV